jgi:2-aminoadipate transaminase
MIEGLVLDPGSGLPLYRQVSEAIARLIETGELQPGVRLPATRELAMSLSVNRTTVSAAYANLEEQGLIRGHVGRGSFVAVPQSNGSLVRLDWERILPKLDARNNPHLPAALSFSTSRPSGDGFPMGQFRRLAKEVVDSPEVREILQLGSPSGYGPLRRYLLAKAREERVAGPDDDLIVTNGCQQALDLLARMLASQGETIVVEDPVYHGLLRVFERTGASIVPAPVGVDGVDPETIEILMARHRPRAVVLTPSFQNPMGVSIPAANRGRILDAAQRHGVVLIENDIYSELRYVGESIPSLKRLDEIGNTILLRSYSKVSFPGLRVGWVIAPRPVIARLAELKQISDLHSDQLSQAVLLRFAESGELALHLERTRTVGALRLSAILNACRRFLPAGATYTTPQGGMNLWIELPAPLNAPDLLSRVQEQGVDFLPGSYFSAGGGHARCLRLSFGGLSPEEIERGIRILGRVAARELELSREATFEPASALV